MTLELQEADDRKLNLALQHNYDHCNSSKPFPKRQSLDSSKLKEFADDSFKFDENSRKLSKQIEKTLWEKEKLLVMSNFTFSHSVFKRLVLETHKNKGLFGKGLNCTRSSPNKITSILYSDNTWMDR